MTDTPDDPNAEGTEASAPKVDVQIEHVPIDELVPYANNARTHTEDDIAELAGMIQEYGWTEPIVIRGRQVAAGHARLRAARKLGLTHVPCVPRDDLTDEQFRAYVIADNRIAEKAGWDKAMLVAEFDALEAADFSLPKTGFSLKDADEVRKAQAKESQQTKGNKDEDKIPEIPANAITRDGDVWELGQHRLICGDSLRAVEQLKEALGLDTVHAIATDPPYAIYGSASGISSSISDDKMVRPFFEKVLELGKALLPWFAHAYVFCDWRSWPSICYAAKNVATMEQKNLLIWDKGDYGMGNNYFNCYECIGFFAKLPPEKTMTGSRMHGQRPIFKPNIARFPRPAGEEREHNAAKPVALIRFLLEQSTGPGDKVLEPFAGSGSTLIACEQIERECYALEIEPHWCDVIIWRWMKLTGQEARLQGTGQTFEEVAHERGEGAAYVGRLSKNADKAAAGKKKRSRKKATKKKTSTKGGASSGDSGGGETVH